MKRFFTIAKELAVAGSLLMLTARFACYTGMLAATCYFCVSAH